MSLKNIGYALLAVGIVVILFSALADVIGIGAQAGFGWKQMIGVAIGLILAALGGWFTIRKSA